MINGIINIYKEKGFTSHDVVAKLRGIIRQKKIGHTGTLDPQAEGVLPVCLGNGTKVCDLLTNKNKTYLAVMQLGVITDTQDLTGNVLESHEVMLTEQEIKTAVLSYEGRYDQVPPMYSALKVNGKKLYELAREGIEVERKARPVEIYSIIIREMDMNNHLVTMEIFCSKGTYIRTLCQDIGEKLGCGACMAALTRIQVDRFAIEESLKLDQVEELWEQDRLMEYMVPVDEMFPDYPKLKTADGADKYLYNGNPLIREMFQKIPELTEDKRFRIYDSKSNFTAVYQWYGEEEILKPVKMFL